MANKEIMPYGFDPSKKPNALALTIVPLEVVAEPPKKLGPRAPIDVSTDLR